jgi:acetyl-CoA carboxylase biotin carboxyl carrier protein
MKIDELRELIKLMRDNQIAEIDLEEGGHRVRVVAAQGGLPVVAPQPVVVVAGGTGSGAPAEIRAEPPAPAKEPEIPPGVPIISPIVGTFYRSASPDSPPYVSPGDEIDEESVLCIVEAMKVMNEIKAEMKGKILEILAENGHPVEFGQPLFRVLPAT